MTGHLDQTLRGLTGYNMSRATTAFLSRVSAVLQGFGLRRVTFSALSVVAENPALRQSQLADALGIERPNIVQIVDELEASGLVRRERSQEDRRAYALAVSDKGIALYRKALEALLELDAEITDCLSESEVARFSEALAKVEKRAGGER